MSAQTTNAPWQFAMNHPCRTRFVEKHNYFNAIEPPKLNKGSKAFGENVRGRTKTKRKDSEAKIFDSTGKNPGKTQKCLVVWEFMKMVITRLEIKTEKEIALVDI